MLSNKGCNKTSKLLFETNKNRSMTFLPKMSSIRYEFDSHEDFLPTFQF